ncbi:MAG: FtsK/SpoIIIE domain-containing protein [Verrucomicrobiota bacterium]
MNEFSPRSTPTASKLLSTAETLALLERLRQGMGDAVHRTDELERDFSARSHKLRSQFEQARATERMRGAAEIAAAEADLAANRERVEASFAVRKARIARAGESAQKQRLAEIEGEESKHTLENQDGLFEAKHVYEADTQNNKTRHAAFANQLADEVAALDRIEARARTALAGYRFLARLITAPPSSPPLDTSLPENQLLEQLRAQRDLAGQTLARCNVFGLPLFFRFFRLWFCLPLILLMPFALAPELRRFDFAAAPPHVWVLVGAALMILLGLYYLGRRLAFPHAQAAARALHSARQLAAICAQKADASFQAESARLLAVHTSTTQRLNDHWKQVRGEARILRSGWTDRLTDQARKLILANEERRRLWLKSINERHEELRARQLKTTTTALEQLETTSNESLARLNATRDASRQAIEADWRHTVLPTRAALQSAGTTADAVFPPWRAELWQRFTLPEEFAGAARFGSLTVDTEKFCGVSLQSKGLTLPGDLQFNVPLLLSVPRQASLLFETKQSGQEQIIGALNNLVLRLLASSPPGRLSFTIFDPVGLGQNFAGIMHLADFEERLINSRIWTQTAQFEQRLADLNEHIEKVTQMYLRNEYETLAEYNAQAGRLAEKYHFLVIADFPSNFSEVAVKRLHNLAASGPRCGVHLLIHWDQRKTAPVEFVPEELRKNAICVVPQGDGFALSNANWMGIKLALDAPPNAELATQLLQQIGKDSTDSYRVEMPFAEVAPDDSDLWSRETTTELRVAVGRTGATKLQYLALGQGTRQHGLIAGKTGSGKSTLFHVIITNLALWCSPEQVEFYLVDFKKGVEFKCYATHKLPHARVIAIESDREFGLSVLQRVDDELKRRGDLFRKLGAQDIAGYKRAGGTEAIPRTLLLIDEFQELFVEDDRVSQGAALLLDRIVRQGRAFGIHVLLGSQTLGGAYSLARATIGQMVVRIALQCNEADAYLIMNEDNPAPRLLSRPGEAIYNDDGGTLQGNSPFQVVWLPDEVRETWLARVSVFAERRASLREPIVFEGNAPASVRDNALLRASLHGKSIQPGATPRIWLGAPNSIKGPTEAIFRRQSGNHLLIVGQREEAALGMLGVALIALAAQHPKSSAQFFVFDCSAPDSAEAKFLEHAVRAVPHEIKLVRAGDVEDVMAALAAEEQQRTDDPGAVTPETYLLIHCLQRNKKFRFDEEMSFSLDAGGNPGLQLNKLICEGASLGFHVIANCDTYNNVMRFLSRKALSEFEMRVVFQMSANDSASLIDSPQANNLGLHRAILFNGQEGWLETFRPYALPDEGWLKEAEQRLSLLHT